MPEPENIRDEWKIDFHILEITTVERNTIRILPINAFARDLRKFSNSDTDYWDWYGRLINEIPKLGSKYIGIFIECKFSPAKFIKQIRVLGGTARFIN